MAALNIYAYNRPDSLLLREKALDNQLKQSNNDNYKRNYDIIISGAGPAGLSMAKAASLLNLQVAVIEKQPLSLIQDPQYDGREIALTHRSRKLLNDFGMWERINPQAISKIQNARVFNGNDKFFMGLSSETAKQLAYTIPNHAIRKSAIEVALDDKNITILDNDFIQSALKSTNECIIKLNSGRELSCKLLIAADSRFSSLRDYMGLKSSRYSFGKNMIVCKMRHQRPHNYIANECFHHGHTMAVLPLNDNCCSMVITAKPEKTEKLMAMNASDFAKWAQDNYQNQLGDMELISQRYSYPLVGVYSEQFVAPRFALIGDAAVGMHPVTAHGFNFGLAGIEFMQQALAKAQRRNLDIGSIRVLKEFEKNHQRATLPLYLGTAMIVTIYTNDTIPARAARQILIRFADKMKPIKSFIMSRLMDDGNISSLPIPRPLSLLRLLRN